MHVGHQFGLEELCEVRLDEPANRAESQLERMPGGRSADAIPIDQPMDDLRHARPVAAVSDHVGTLPELRYGVGHGH